MHKKDKFTSFKDYILINGLIEYTGLRPRKIFREFIELIQFFMTIKTVNGHLGEIRTSVGNWPACPFLATAMRTFNIILQHSSVRIHFF